MSGVLWRRATALILGGLIAFGLTLGLVSCGQGPQAGKPAPSRLNLTTPGKAGSSDSKGGLPRNVKGDISEGSPPTAIQELSRDLEQYQPQVQILSPKPEAILQGDSVAVQFQVDDLPLFQNPKLKMGPHLHVILDNQPYQAVYDVSQPIVFNDLAPGTHTIRAFASRPWHESFKNEGAYAQVSFHVFTKTAENNPSPDKPLLTFSRPKGSYGAEPILLDFYLTNAPLHLVAQENDADNIGDWQIRCTINGDSFTLDRWQPLYLQGFKPGKNWIQLELLDQQGNPIANAFNRTTRIITYEPGGQEPLDRLVRGELKPADARGIVDPGALFKAADSVTPSQPSPSPIATSKPKASPTPKASIPIPPVVIPSTPAPAPTVKAIPVPVKPEPKASTTTSVDQSRKEIKLEATPQPEQPGGFFNRFRRAKATGPTIPSPEVIPSPSIAPKSSPAVAPLVAPKPVPAPSALPEVKLTPAPQLPQVERSPSVPQASRSPLPASTPELIPPGKSAESVLEPAPLESSPAIPSAPKSLPSAVEFKKDLGGFFNRFRRQSTKEETAPTLTPTPELPTLEVPEKVTSNPQASPKLETVVSTPTPKPSLLPTPKPSPAAKVPEQAQPQPLPSPSSPAVFKPGKSAASESAGDKSGGVFSRFQHFGRSDSTTAPTPKSPKITVTPAPPASLEPAEVQSHPAGSPSVRVTTAPTFSPGPPASLTPAPKPAPAIVLPKASPVPQASPLASPVPAARVPESKKSPSWIDRFRPNSPSPAPGSAQPKASDFKTTAPESQPLAKQKLAPASSPSPSSTSLSAPAAQPTSLPFKFPDRQSRFNPAPMTTPSPQISIPMLSQPSPQAVPKPGLARELETEPVPLPKKLREQPASKAAVDDRKVQSQDQEQDQETNTSRKIAPSPQPQSSPLGIKPIPSETKLRIIRPSDEPDIPSRYLKKAAVQQPPAIEDAVTSDR